MASTLATAKDTFTTALDQGISGIDKKLQAQFDSANPNPAVVTLLNGLRSRYIFDKMQAIRASIILDDDSPDLGGILSALDGACGELTAIQNASATTNKWINTASDGLSKAFTIYGRVAKLLDE